MDRNILAFFATTFFFMLACSPKSETNKQLVVVDSLLLGHNNVDSALPILENIEPLTKEDSAYYNILKVSAAYRSENPIKNFKGINASIKYYTDNYDTRKLAYAYYYKTSIFFDADSIVADVLSLLKKAEQQAEKTSDYRLLNRIFSALTVANARCSELEEALKCAQKELLYAKKLNDNYCKAYALINLAILHHYLHPNTDSSTYYIQQCKNFADEVENKDKAYIYNYIGQTLMSTDIFSATKYFIDALKYDKISEAYLNLAKLYFNENKYDIAQQYCDSALILPSLQSKKETYTLMAEYYYKNNDIKQFRSITEKIAETQANISSEKESRRLLELQKKFDYEKQKAEYDRRKMLFSSAISILSVLLVVIILLHKLKVQKIRERDLSLENQNSQLYNELMLMTANEDFYKKQIIELETENQNLSSQKINLSRTIANNKTHITILQNKVEDLNKQKYEYIETGKHIYNRIEQNQPITMFDEKWANCVYYFIFNKQGEIFDGYNNLTVSDKIFLITDLFLQKSDDEIAKILAVSPGTVRSRRSKIKKKKNIEDVDA